MLIELLKEIFTSYGYVKYEINHDEYQSCLFLHEEKEEYFILLDKETIYTDELESFITEGIQNLYTDCENLDVTSETFEKNSTLLICINNDEIDMDLCNKIEEDAYLFKKNILIYNDRNIEELERQIDNNFSLNKLNELLNNGEGFDNNRSNVDSAYGLLAKVFIKLPFLSYKREGRELENLYETIRKQANSENLYNLYIQVSSNLLQVDSLNSYQNIIDAKLILGDNNE